MKIAYGLSPGTCGEFIQGITQDEPCLVSSPVNLYARSLLWRDGEVCQESGEKAKAGLRAFMKRHDLEDEIDSLSFVTRSDIPLMKGMASSTSDIASLISAAASYYEIELPEEELSELCISVEPSDNLMFGKLNLYNHYSGRIFERWESTIEADVLVLELDDTVDTVGFGYDTEYHKDIEAFQDVIALLREGAEEGSLEKIAKACTDSARINQTALERPYLDALIERVEAYGGKGLMIGHSGSIIGIIFDEDFDQEGFLDGLDALFAGSARLLRSFNLRLIPGGVTGGVIHDAPEALMELKTPEAFEKRKAYVNLSE